MKQIHNNLPSYDILVRLNVPIMQGALSTSRRRIARMSLITLAVAVPVPIRNNRTMSNLEQPKSKMRLYIKRYIKTHMPSPERQGKLLSATKVLYKLS